MRTDVAHLYNNLPLSRTARLPVNAEEARRRAEAAPIQAEQEKAIAQERARRQRLSSEANWWAQSIRIRDYVEHIRTLVAGRGQTSADLNQWTEWALSAAAEIDPTAARLNPATEESSVEPQE